MRRRDLAVPRVKEWSEAGNTLYRTASIQMYSTPLPLWLLDKWLWIADEFVHLIEHRLPRDETHGWSAIDRISESWGNPICAAYLYSWGTWYRKRQRRDVHVEVKFEQLSKQTQEWLEAESKED